MPCHSPVDKLSLMSWKVEEGQFNKCECCISGRQDCFMVRSGTKLRCLAASAKRRAFTAVSMLIWTRLISEQSGEVLGSF